MTEIKPHCARPSVYFALRRMSFPWWTCARIMWHGATLRMVEAE